MRTWYCVTSSFDDRGHVTAGIVVTRRADKKPDDTFHSTARKDIYNTWCGNLREAQAYVKEALQA